VSKHLAFVIGRNGHSVLLILINYVLFIFSKGLQEFVHFKNGHILFATTVLQLIKILGLIQNMRKGKASTWALPTFYACTKIRA